MNAFGTAARRVALLVALVALSVGAGSALAAEGTPPGQAKATTPPGNSDKAGKAKADTTTTTTTTSTSQGAGVSTTAKAKNDAKPAATSTAKPAKTTSAETKPAKTKSAETKPAKTKPATTTESNSYKANSSGTNLDKPGQNHRHTICHATGSAKNPYVRISPSVSGVYDGHLAHQDGRDIIPPFTYEGTTYSKNWPSGQAIFNAGCATSTTSPPPPPPPASVTSKKVTICHATSSAKNPFVIITIDESGWLNGHKDHAGDVFIGEGEVTGVTPEKCAATELRGVTPPPPPCVTNCGNGGNGGNKGGSAPKLNSAPTPAQNAAGQQPGGILGAQAELPANNAPAAGNSAAEKPARGVLGAVKRLGSTATSETLPFTGLPLWIVLASGLALLAVGLGLRRGWART